MKSRVFVIAILLALIGVLATVQVGFAITTVSYQQVAITTQTVIAESPPGSDQILATVETTTGVQTAARGAPQAVFLKAAQTITQIGDQRARGSTQEDKMSVENIACYATTKTTEGVAVACSTIGVKARASGVAYTTIVQQTGGQYLT